MREVLLPMAPILLQYTLLCFYPSWPMALMAFPAYALLLWALRNS